MSLLGIFISTKARLLPRNEGKLKSYESCTDLRAWSLDEQARSKHLKEWIKGDMPICILPVCTLASFFRAMTCKSRSRATPRCHPNCMSKVLIDSICSSCHAINDCLKCDPNFDKYFAEEELETCHWPCDKCLDILKSIKMFWKILIEKVFGINISKTDEFESIQSDNTRSVKSVAKLWEREIVQQAMFVKSITPLMGKNLNSNSSFWKQTPLIKENTTRIPRPTRTTLKEPLNQVKSPTHSFMSQRSKLSDAGKSGSSFSKNCRRPSRKIHRCISVRVKTADAACNCDLDKNNDDVLSYKLNVACLQQKCDIQESEIEKLKRENTSLKLELQNFYKTTFNLPKRNAFVDALSYCDLSAMVPKPFESCIKDDTKGNDFTNTDSEMSITMKNCKNENFNHVSFLQILHKTNEPLDKDELKFSGSKKENPIALLTKVRNTFGEIVKREIKIVANKHHDVDHDIEATFCRLNSSTSAPSCSTFYTNTDSSKSNIANL
ncbi:hypothetical protein evm_000776 [Chilo suppressalis]|nr:hypothetical protein evm_000776 [Chilo suppressalis]